jgi:hypothetical protein
MAEKTSDPLCDECGQEAPIGFGIVNGDNRFCCRACEAKFMKRKNEVEEDGYVTTHPAT